MNQCIYSWKVKMKSQFAYGSNSTSLISFGSQPDKQRSLRTHHNLTNKSPSLSLLFHIHTYFISPQFISLHLYNLHYYVNLSYVPVCVSCSLQDHMFWVSDLARHDTSWFYKCVSLPGLQRQLISQNQMLFCRARTNVMRVFSTEGLNKHLGSVSIYIQLYMILDRCCLELGT